MCVFEGWPTNTNRARGRVHKSLPLRHNRARKTSFTRKPPPARAPSPLMPPLLFSLSLLLACSGAPPALEADWGHGWATVGSMLWIDIAARAGTLTPQQLDFLAATYSIISLEKCFNSGAADAFPGNSEGATRNASAELHARNPNAKVLFYFHMHKYFRGCYASNALFNEAEWAATDNAGAPIAPILYNLSLPAVRAYIADAVAAAEGGAPNAADGLPFFDGVFGDGVHDAWSEYNIGDRYASIMEGSHASLQGVRGVVRARMRPLAKFVGNGITMYAGNPVDHGLAVLPFVDGFCHEHFLAFEQLDRATGALLPAVFATVVSALRNASAQGRVVLVRGWPGPACQPITAMGPGWCGAEAAPGTAAGRAAAAQRLLKTRLAAFLVLCDRFMFFTWNWWYDQNAGGVPCLAGQEAACTFSAGWYPELALPLGAPLGDFSLSGAAVYTREFAHASVRFNAGNVSDSWVQWRSPPSSASPAPSPSPSPAATPAGDPSPSLGAQPSPQQPPEGAPASGGGAALSGGAAAGVVAAGALLAAGGAAAAALLLLQRRWRWPAARAPRPARRSSSSGASRRATAATLGAGAPAEGENTVGGRGNPLWGKGGARG